MPSSAASSARSSRVGCVLTSKTETSAFVCAGASRLRVAGCPMGIREGAAWTESDEEQVETVGDWGGDCMFLEALVAEALVGGCRFYEVLSMRGGRRTFGLKEELRCRVTDATER